MYDPIKDVNHEEHDISMQDYSSESEGRQSIRVVDDDIDGYSDQSSVDSPPRTTANSLHIDEDDDTVDEDEEDEDDEDDSDNVAEEDGHVTETVDIEEDDDYSSSLTDVSDTDIGYEQPASSPSWRHSREITNGTPQNALHGRSHEPFSGDESPAEHSYEHAMISINGASGRLTNGSRTQIQNQPVRSAHPMSISAMLSNPLEDIVRQPAPIEPAAAKTVNINTKAKTPKRKRDEDSTLAKRSNVKATSESKRKRESKNSKVVAKTVLDVDNAPFDSAESDSSDEEQYSDSRAKYLDGWGSKCAKIIAAEQLTQRRRAVEISGRLLANLDRRVRRITKAFDNRHYRGAMVRATFEEGVRREQQRKGLSTSKKASKHSTMAPPTISKKMSKKQKKKELAAIAAAAAAAAALEAQKDSNHEENGKSKKSSGTSRAESIHDSIWKDIIRKEIPKVHRIIQTNNTNRSINLKKTGQLCAKEARRWQSRTNKTAKDMQAKSKRAMREMLIFWKRNERGDLINRQKAEKEIIDKAKKEEEDRESRRQARKLNFLITQTELYSHFIGSKVKTAEAEQSEDTSGDVGLQANSAQRTPPVDVQLLKPGETAAELDFDADDDDALRAAAARNAQEAVQKAKQKAQGFDTESGSRAHVMTGDLQADADAMNLDFQNPTTIGDAAIAQPRMLNATLKEYQLKGLNWLVNLYEQGINGILADEMGLGKTVQSISVMAHLAETYNIWGPFLVIAPASTLHNWQQEITKFVPRLKALPYWGNTKDRKVLRKFWDRKRATYTEDAPFHVVITSYQLVVQDSQYFQNVKWQYMILDEAQAIKSSQSSRWKNLLGFKCRNRLLLTGTPIQNTMQELWALLHFIMPSLFDSHNEFSEWFSKDIESHAQKNSELNEEQLKRLHMILKPFMLRRIKKNVQKELGDKIELDVFCDLNMRQRGLYSFLRKEISMKDILEKASSDKDADLSSLMNLVMQLRKVCNHPDLFERADVRAPLALIDMPKTANILKEGRSIELTYAATSAVKYRIPKFLYRAGGILDVPSESSLSGSRKHCLTNLMNIFTEINIKQSASKSGGTFSSSRLAGWSPSEIVATKRDPMSAAIAKMGLKRNIDTEHHSPQALLRIVAADQYGSSSQAPAGGALHNLMSIHKHVAELYGYHRIEPIYDPSVLAPPIEVLCPDRTFVMQKEGQARSEGIRRLLYGLSLPEETAVVQNNLYLDASVPPHGVLPVLGHERRGYNNIRMPSMQTFITDSGKLSKLDELLTELKKNDHRVLLYFQMTKMIDLMEEYLVYRQYKYLRLDGSSKISDRRDMVSDWQTRPELFVFLLSTRAGGLGINLTAADTVIFYDSDWNPTIDSQAMDRAHRLGQTKQVTVYRLITRGSIEERILSRAKEKEEVQKVVISGGDYKQGTTDNIQFQAQKGGGRDVVSWLLEDDDQVKKVSQQLDSMPTNRNKKSKVRQGPSLDDLYHEGENKMESEAHTPEMQVDGDEDEPVRKKKKSSSKKSRLQEM